MYFIFRFYILSSLHVGCALLALTKLTAGSLEIDLPIQLEAAIFGITVSGYNILKYGMPVQTQNNSITLGIKTVTILGMAIALFGFLPLSWHSILSLGLIGILSLIYGIQGINLPIKLRSTKGLKIVLVALVWVLVTIFLPLSVVKGSFENLSPFLVLSRFVFVIVATLPFELRDLHHDDSKLGTWPQLLGVQGSKILGYVLLLFFLAFEMAHLHEVSSIVSALVVAIILGIFLAFSSDTQSPFYSSFWVESTPIIWWLLLLFSQSCAS